MQIARIIALAAAAAVSVIAAPTPQDIFADVITPPQNGQTGVQVQNGVLAQSNTGTTLNAATPNSPTAFAGTPVIPLALQNVITQTDVQVLAIALILEKLESFFYMAALVGLPVLTAAGQLQLDKMGNVLTNNMPRFTAMDFMNAGYAPWVHAEFLKIAIAEVAHVLFIEKTLTAFGQPAQVPCTFNINAGLVNLDAFLQTAFAFERIGELAYTGAHTLVSPLVLKAALSIVKIESKHTALVALLNSLSTGGSAFGLSTPVEGILELTAGTLVCTPQAIIQLNAVKRIEVIPQAARVVTIDNKMITVPIRGSVVLPREFPRVSVAMVPAAPTNAAGVAAVLAGKAQAPPAVVVGTVVDGMNALGGTTIVNGAPFTGLLLFTPQQVFGTNIFCNYQSGIVQHRAAALAVELINVANMNLTPEQVAGLTGVSLVTRRDGERVVRRQAGATVATAAPAVVFDNGLPPTQLTVQFNNVIFTMLEVLQINKQIVTIHCPVPAPIANDPELDEALLYIQNVDVDIKIEGLTFFAAPAAAPPTAATAANGAANGAAPIAAPATPAGSVLYGPAMLGIYRPMT